MQRARMDAVGAAGAVGRELWGRRELWGERHCRAAIAAHSPVPWRVRWHCLAPAGHTLWIPWGLGGAPGCLKAMFRNHCRRGACRTAPRQDARLEPQQRDQRPSPAQPGALKGAVCVGFRLVTPI